jgi:hypothetical protein
MLPLLHAPSLPSSVQCSLLRHICRVCRHAVRPCSPTASVQGVLVSLLLAGSQEPVCKDLRTLFQPKPSGTTCTFRCPAGPVNSTAAVQCVDGRWTLTRRCKCVCWMVHYMTPRTPGPTLLADVTHVLHHPLSSQLVLRETCMPATAEA